jgi:magnesium transporter
MANHRFFAFSKAGMSSVEALADAIAALDREGFVWFDLYNPTREDLTALAGPLGLSSLSVEDVLDEDQVPKMEDFPAYTFVLVNGYPYEKGELGLREFDFCIGKKFLVTSHRGDGSRHFGARLDDRLKHDIDQAQHGPDFLCHLILDQIVDEKFAVIEKLEEELEEAEEAILEDVLHFKPEILLRLRRRLLTVRKSLLHEREVLAKICRKDSPFIGEQSLYHFRDIYDHLVRFFETTEITREMISNLMEMYLSMLNNRMNMAANQMNLVVKRLTYVTTIFMPLTLLAGVGGMSEWSMMTGAQNWRIAYPAFLAMMAAVAVLNYLLFRYFDRKRAATTAGLVAPPLELVGAPEELPRKAKVVPAGVAPTGG